MIGTALAFAASELQARQPTDGPPPLLAGAALEEAFGEAKLRLIGLRGPADHAVGGIPGAWRTGPDEDGCDATRCRVPHQMPAGDALAVVAEDPLLLEPDRDRAPAVVDPRRRYRLFGPKLCLRR